LETRERRRKTKANGTTAPPKLRRAKEARTSESTLKRINVVLCGERRVEASAPTSKPPGRGRAAGASSVGDVEEEAKEARASPARKEPKGFALQVVKTLSLRLSRLGEERKKSAPTVNYIGADFCVKR
jgi:hypothetical protein